MVFVIAMLAFLFIEVKLPYWGFGFFAVFLFCTINIFFALFKYYKKITKEYEKVSAKKEKELEEEEYRNASYILGVEDTFALKENNDIVVVGNLRGTVKNGYPIYIKNFSEDDTITLAIINGIEVWDPHVNKNVQVHMASNRHVALRIADGTKLNLKKGTILFSHNTKTNDVCRVYTNTIGDTFVSGQKLEFSEKDKAQMSISDCAEIWRLFQFYREKNGEETGKIKEDNDIKLEVLSEILCDKILRAPYIYTLYSKKTGEPYLYSYISRIDRDGEESYAYSSPAIILLLRMKKMCI